MGHPRNAVSEQGISQCSGISGICGMSSGQPRNNRSLLSSNLTTLQEKLGKWGGGEKPQKIQRFRGFWGQQWSSQLAKSTTFSLLLLSGFFQQPRAIPSSRNQQDKKWEWQRMDHPCWPCSRLIWNSSISLPKAK